MLLYFWTFAFQTTTYLINRLPTPILGHQSPFEKLFKKRPNYTKLRVFGCLSYPWLRPYTSYKLDPHSPPCVFIGYSLEHNAYCCFDPVSHKLFVFCHVAFVESEFLFHNLSLKADRVTNTSLSQWSLLDQPTHFPIPHTHTLSSRSPNTNPPHITHYPPNDLVHLDSTFSSRTNVGHLYDSS